MKTFLRKELPFIFLLTLFNLQLFATPECPIITGNFTGLALGTTVNTSSTGWYIDASNVSGATFFAVKSNRFHAENLGGEGIWYSRVFSVAGYSSFQVAVKISSEGLQNSSEYVKVYYKINGGAETLLDQRTGNFGTIDFTSGTLTGNNVQLIVKMYNYNNGSSQSSKYYIEQYRVFKENGPCAGGISVTAAAANSGVLPCTNPSLTLSASTTATGTTTYSWTGPGSFTSTSQTPVVTVAGTYNVVATNAAGSGAASITVIANQTPPDVTATGGSLACASSLVIHASSSVAGASYSWSGPGSFTSTLQNPTVNAAGTYTVTVTNPANGCTASQPATVSAGTATVSNFWTEDFTFANGVTTDTGSTRWSIQNTSAGIFSVQNNEFRVSNIGTATEGVWTSDAITISGKSNVSIAVGVRSGVSAGGALENSGSSLDYIRVYYKLNGGSEVLISENLGAINSNSATNSTVSVSGLSGTTLQVIIRSRATGSDEFYYFDNIVVAGTNGAATVTTSVTGVPTCTATAQLFATASSTATAYAWTGPNGFTSSLQNPVISAGGQYTVTATLAGGCTVAAPITVAENKTPPNITATGGVLACLSSVVINVNSSVAGVTYTWTGPNGFTSSQKNPTVSTLGTYTATVTNPANGCTASQAVTVSSGTTTPAAFWLEDFTLTNGTTSDSGSTLWTSATAGTGTYSVQNNEFKTSFTGAGEGVWSSAAIDISGKSGVVISVDLRSETASASDFFESDDYIRVYYKLNGGAETLVYEDMAGINSTTTGTASISITSAALNGSSLQVIIKTRNSDPTERYFFDNVKLTGADRISENAVATANGVLGCTVNTVTLSGSSSAGGVSYSWSGPGGFTSTAQNPTVGTAGIYTLTITNQATGCTGSDTANVIINTNPPGATATVSGQLTCASGTSVTLSATSPVAGVSYSWSGPGGFTSTLQNPTVSVAGTYNVAVTNPANGCTATASVPVTVNNTTSGIVWLEDFNLPNGTTSEAGAWSVSSTPAASVFAVQNNVFTVSNTTTTGESVWASSVIDISGKTNIALSAVVRSAITGEAVMNNSGTYIDYLRFYYKLNGGAEVLFAEKLGAINNHSATYTAITGNTPAGTNLQIIVRARASGPDEFYYFDNIQVTGNSQSIVSANATANGILTCNNTPVLLNATSATAGVTYNWSGPNSFTSTIQNPTVTTPGIYTLTVALGGCTATDTALVAQNVTPPGASITTTGILTCINTSVTMTGASATAGVTYSWSGPGGYTSAAAVVPAYNPGVYMLTVTNPINGCTSVANITIADNRTPVNDLTITPVSSLISCSNPSATITASASTTPVSYSWTGPNGFTATTPVITVNTPGRYTLLATNTLTGCTTSALTDVFADTLKPANVAITPAPAAAQITCTNSSVSLTGSSSSSGVTYAWSGPNNFVAAGVVATVNTAGLYTLTATSQATGCAATAVVTVTQNMALPLNVSTSANPSSGQITCAHPAVVLTGNSSTTGVAYNWSGPGGFTAATANATVSAPGTYVLTVTNISSGCTAVANTVVTRNITVPGDVTARNSDQLSCYTPSVFVIGTSSTPGVTYTWAGPGGFTANTAMAETDRAGAYVLTVTNPSNGCTSTSMAVVEDRTAPPTGVTASNSGPLNCAHTSVTLTGNSTTLGVTYTWIAPDETLIDGATITVTQPGTYTLVVVDTSNGCASVETTTVLQNTVGCMSAANVSAGTTNKEELPQRVAATGAATTFEYRTYPNPFSNRAFIEFKSPEATLVTVTIFNSYGVKVKELFNKTVVPGQLYKLEFSTGNLLPGTYHCVIRNNNKVHAVKMVMIK